MCGIIGYIGLNKISPERWRNAAARQLHRGPDSQGDYNSSIGHWEMKLGHQRLSIIDLSQSGHQPMIGKSAESILSFNGEIYNYLEIRDELQKEGKAFEGNSDTEILLSALETWGVAKTQQKLDGMWAWTLLEPLKKRLTLSRDRFGEKPLFWTCDGTSLFFASEIKSLLALTQKRFPLNAKTISNFAKQSLANVDEQTYYEGIFQLPPAHNLSLDLNQPTLAPLVTKYWEPHLEQSHHSQSIDACAEEIQHLFKCSIERRLRSDVPVGILLSGGIDSSAIAGVAIKEFGADVQLLSATSADARFDESSFIDRMGRYLKRPVNKVQLELNPTTLFEELEVATWFADSPVWSLSNIAHRNLIRKAKELGVTVILSGQGADEIFCGYKKYLGFYIQHLARTKRKPKAAATLFRFFLNKSIVNQFNLAEAKRYLPFIKPSKSLDYFGEYIADKPTENIGLKPNQSIESRQLEDLWKYSVPTLTQSEDRMSMSHSREIRLPFLEHSLVELALNLPTEHKLSNGWTKHVFRRAVSQYLPKEITWRKDKQGFVNPQSEWLKSELREKTIRTFFNTDSLIFKYKLIDRKKLLMTYDAFCKQRPNSGRIWFKDIFNPIALEIWLRTNESTISN